MRIVSWNVNSVRLRLEGLEMLVRTLAPDVLCLQEIKARNEAFPKDVLRSLGYEHGVVHGQAGYHGVATFARRPIKDVESLVWCGKPDARHLRVRIAGIAVHNLYVPAGGNLPDPELSGDKFRHKLDFLDQLTSYFDAGPGHHEDLVIAGDLNVAPLPTDVWNHRQLLRVVSHTPVEVQALGRLAGAGRFTDAIRLLIPPEVRLYSWWSYRARDWAASDRGRRLDHIWLSPGLVPALAGGGILADVRGWAAPSDHVPVWSDLSSGSRSAGGGR